jgi:predicted nucleic acid-binding protein
MKTWLLDTGPLVAFLEADDPAHDRAIEILSSFAGILLTTGPVVTEAFYLLRYARGGGRRLVEFIEHTNALVIDVFGLGELRKMAELMEKYAKAPMDFADASLVLVAEERNCNEVLTLDERGFSTYRFRGSRRFRLPLQNR